MNEKNLTFKQRVWEIVEATDHEDQVRKNIDYFDIFILILILLNAAAVILETVQAIEDEYGAYFFWFEVVSVFIFSLEYVARVWASTSQEKYAKPFWGRVKFMLTPLAIIDLLAILPFYLAIAAFDLRFLRTLRIFRLLRLLKIA